VSRIDEIKRKLTENTEDWAKTANQVIEEARNSDPEAQKSEGTEQISRTG